MNTLIVVGIVVAAVFALLMLALAGVEVTLVELKDIQLPDSMKRAMACQAEWTGHLTRWPKHGLCDLVTVRRAPCPPRAGHDR